MRWRLPLCMVLLLALAGCTRTDVGYSGTAGAPKVAIIGDSLTYEPFDEHHSALDPTYQVVISATVGHTIGWQQWIAVDYAATAPDIIVINLGTNDAIKDLPTTQSVADLDAMLALFPDSCVVLANINEHMTESSAPLAHALNQAITERAVELIDWNAAVEADPDLLRTGAVHATPEGYTVLVQLTSDAIGRCAATLPSG